MDGTATDETGNYSCIIEGSPVNVTGKDGLAMEFDGIDDAVRCPINAFPYGNNVSRTISMWVKSNYPQTTFNLFGDSTNGGTDGFNMNYRADSNQIYSTDGGDTSYSFIPTENKSTVWFHIIYILNDIVGQQQVDTYLDGVYVATTTDDQNIGAGGDSYVGIGASYAGASWNRGFNGTIDDVIIWDRVLSDAGCSINQTCGGEIGELYSSYSAVTASPEIILYAPANNDRDNTDLQVDFVVTDDDNSTLDCDLYIDGTLNASNSSVVNNTHTYFSPDWSEGSHQWYVNCTDAVNVNVSDTYTFTLDLTQPFITSILPSYLNTTIYTGYSMSISGNVTDNSLFRGNMTIFYPNSTLFYNNYTGNLTVNTTEYSWLWAFNTTLEPNGLWELHLDWADSHTAQYFPDALFTTAAPISRQLTFGFADNTIEVSLVGGTVLGLFDGISTTKLYDRYTFNLNFNPVVPPNAKMVFRVTSENPIYYLAESEYTAHLVTGSYWLDFDGVEATAVVTKVDDYTYDVELTTTNSRAEFIFNSLGGLNENNEIIQFTLNNCIPDWVCSGYAPCNISNLAPCNETTDNNACGQAYSGDYSEFTPQSCNYCSASLTLYSESDCDSVTDLKELCYDITNFGTCCNITLAFNNTDDCPYGNSSSGCVNESCSIFDYSEDDISSSIINVIVKFIIAVGSLVVIWVIMFGTVWGRNKMGLKKK